MTEIRYFASIAEAAGRPAESVDLPADMTAGRLRDHMARGRDPEFVRLLHISALLVNGVSADETTPVPDESRVDVLPPFAGG